MPGRRRTVASELRGERGRAAIEPRPRSKRSPRGNLLRNVGRGRNLARYAARDCWAGSKGRQAHQAPAGERRPAATTRRMRAYQSRGECLARRSFQRGQIVMARLPTDLGGKRTCVRKCVSCARPVDDPPRTGGPSPVERGNHPSRAWTTAPRRWTLMSAQTTTCSAPLGVPTTTSCVFLLTARTDQRIVQGSPERNRERPISSPPVASAGL
jgi:hypothetical protein